MLNKKGKSYYFCWTFFIAFVIFLYGPTFTIVVLSFQGPEGGLTFPMNGFSFHWFQKLWEGGGYVDIGSAFRRSIFLGLITNKTPMKPIITAAHLLIPTFSFKNIKAKIVTKNGLVINKV